MNQYKTNNCGELTLNNENQEVVLSGWVSTVRDLGGILFIAFASAGLRAEISKNF